MRNIYRHLCIPLYIRALTNWLFDYQLVVCSPTTTAWLFGLGEQDKGTAGCGMVLGSHSSMVPGCYHILFGGITIHESSVGPYRLIVACCDVCFVS